MEQVNRDDDILFLIKRLNKLLEADFTKRLDEYGLTIAQGRILFFIWHKTTLSKEEVHQNDIEERFSLSKSTVSGMIDRLVNKNLIKKTTAHRYVNLEVTDSAVELIELFKSNRQITINKLTKGLSEEEVERMKRDIKLLINNIKEEEK